MVKTSARATATRIAHVALLWAFVALLLATADGRLDGDDHYALWSVRSIQAGVPFYDPGSPLQSWLSYLGQALSGYRTVGELALAVAFRVAGIIAVYQLGKRLTGQGSAVLGAAGVALMTLGSTVYGCERLMLYPLACLLFWRYREGRLAPGWLGVLAATAFLLRHDHGLYVGLVGGLLIALTNWRHLPRYAVTAIIVLSPWLLWVQLSEGVVVYFERRLDFSITLGLTNTRPSLLELTLPFTPRESLLWL